MATRIRQNGRAMFLRELTVRPMRVNGRLNDLPDRLLRSSPIEVWALTVGSGATTVKGLVNGWPATPTDVTFGAAGIGDGRTAGAFNGTSSYIDIFSAQLAAAFNPNAGTIICWGWITEFAGDFDYMVELAVNSTNRVGMARWNSAGRVACFHQGGGTYKVDYIDGLALGTFYGLGMGWSVTNDKIYNYAITTGYRDVVSGLGTWAGTLTRARIGATATGATPSSFFDGRVQYVALYDYLFSQAQFENICNL